MLTSVQFTEQRVLRQVDHYTLNSEKAPARSSQKGLRILSNEFPQNRDRGTPRTSAGDRIGLGERQR